MDRNKSHILEIARKQGRATPSAGLDVPEGYFDSFTARMTAALPERPELEHPDDIEAETAPRTFWQTVRPYVYMAAMFAGVWLMLQLFTMLTGTGRLQPMDSTHVLAEAPHNDDFLAQFVYADFDSWDIVDEMVEDGSLDADFEFVTEDIPENIVLPQ